MSTGSPTIGVLALQGGVAEHARMVEALGARASLVRSPTHLRGPDGPRIDALILPGGESSTIDRLIRLLDLSEPLREMIAAGMPTLGTCAGMILLSREIKDPAPGQQSLGMIDIAVRRNAFGAQVASAEGSFAVEGVTGLGDDGRVLGALIRAPEVVRIGPNARPITVEGERVLGVTSTPTSSARLGSVTAVAFHPELSGDPALHRALLAQAAAR